MKITTLQDASDYQRTMIDRMLRNSAATEHDHYILEIIEDRIAENGAFSPRSNDDETD